MKKIICASLFAAVSSSNVIAAPSFEGFSVSAGLAAVGTEFHAKEYSAGDGVDVDASLGDVAGVARLDVSYLKAINNNFLIGLGATYDLNKVTSNAISFGDDCNDYGPTKVELKNHFSLYAQPTYVLREGTALYGKVSYHHADSSFNDQCNSNYETSATKQSLNGVGVGLGLETFLTDNAFLKVEGNYIHYMTEHSNSNTADTGYGDTYTVSLQPNQAEGVVSLGYKF